MSLSGVQEITRVSKLHFPNIDSMLIAGQTGKKRKIKLVNNMTYLWSNLIDKDEKLHPVSCCEAVK
jgi:hypothetical protein